MSDTLYTAAEVMEALASSDVGEDDGGGYIDWWEVSYSDEIPTDIGIIKVVESVGGEGQGDHMHVVIQTQWSGQYFKMEGYYSSYDGSEWDGDLKEVNLVERMVKFYE